MHTQLQETADADIIQSSNGLCCAPAVHVPKTNGKVQNSIDFIQLNKVTKKTHTQCQEQMSFSRN